MRRRPAGAASGDSDADGGTFRALVSQGGKFILNNMRLLRIALGVLFLLLILSLICCILSSVFIGIDLKSDSTTSVKVVPEIPDEPSDNVTIDPTCSDGNSCTIDFERESGGCESIPFPEGTACNDVCVVGPGSCEYVELQKGVTKSMCTGTCGGDCEDSVTCDARCSAVGAACFEECGTNTPCIAICTLLVFNCQIACACPDLIPAPVKCEPECTVPRGDVTTPACYRKAEFIKTCSSGRCFWETDLPLGILFQQGPIDDIFRQTDVPRDMGCRDNEWFRAYCMGLVSDDDPIKSCLVPIVDCRFSCTLVPEVNIEDCTDDLRVVSPFCVYHYWCS